ncbi:MAG: DUF6468 domain-containing protein [Dehalococcoidia bacterium]|nr:DUF6468 domain-containing protein [Dehalococcoidia bacterium]
MTYSLIVDLFVAILLVVTIGYAIVLNRRLGKLRGDKAELEKLATTFGESTVCAEESIEKLRNAADMLQDRMEKAEALRDDLAFLIDRGGKAADKLEDLVRATRDKVGIGPQSVSENANPDVDKGDGQSRPLTARRDGPAGTDTDVDGVKSEAERELLKAIRSSG